MISAKDLTNAGIDRTNRLLLRLRLATQYRFGLLNQYQPNPFAEDLDGRGSLRQCRDRFDAFSALLPVEPLSFLDVGCNTGYFTFRLAERGGLGVGLDVGRNEIMVCQALAELNRVGNVAFSRWSLTPANVVGLPTVDVVVLLSVFHHFVRHFGHEPAMTMLAEVAGKARRYIVFETGQPNEDSTWADQLRFMGSEPASWAEQTLRSLGFGRVHHLGQFATSVSQVQRHLVLGERTSGG